jgi:hypothetical protein
MGPVKGEHGHTGAAKNTLSLDRPVVPGIKTIISIITHHEKLTGRNR